MRLLAIRFLARLLSPVIGLQLGCAASPETLALEQIQARLRGPRLAGSHPCDQGQDFSSCESACFDNGNAVACVRLRRRGDIRSVPGSWHTELKSRTESACIVGQYVEACANLHLPTIVVSCRQEPPLSGEDAEALQEGLAVLDWACARGDLHACFEASIWNNYCGQADSPRWSRLREDAQRACDAGASSQACAALADLSELGLGGDQNVQAARGFRADACEQGHKAACEALTYGRIGDFLLTYRILEAWPAKPVDALRKAVGTINGDVRVEFPFCVLGDGSVEIPSTSSDGTIGGEIVRVLSDYVTGRKYAELPGVDPNGRAGCITYTYNVKFR